MSLTVVILVFLHQGSKSLTGCGLPGCQVFHVDIGMNPIAQSRSVGLGMIEKNRLLGGPVHSGFGERIIHDISVQPAGTVD